MIKVSYKKIDLENDSNVDISKLFGTPVLPEGMLEELEDDDYFIGQIKMEDLNNFKTQLPKTGRLYFFLNVKSYPYQARVIYSNAEPKVVVDEFNGGFDFLPSLKPLALTFEEGDGDIAMFGDFVDSVKEEYDLHDYIPLLSIDSLSSPDFPNLGAIDGYYYFVIKNDDLKTHKFDKVKFIAYGS